MSNKISMIFIFFIILSSPLVKAENTDDEEPFIAFEINIISPNTCPARNQWAPVMEEALPKVGIGIAEHLSTGWGNIMARTWSYPVGQEGYEDHIPTYEEGGFDILFVGWSLGLDWDPRGLYDTQSVVPDGDNLYQFSNNTYDQLLSEYIVSHDPIIRKEKAKKMQEILYNELPSIVMVYDQGIYGLNENLLGINTSLLHASYHRAENWSNPGASSIIYALPAELTEYNTFLQVSYYDAQWQQAVYYGLFERDPMTLYMEPVIARNYTLSTDGLTYTVDIHPNAFFSNGDPVTAYDVDYSYELYMTPAVHQNYRILTNHFSDNDSIVALDEDTIQFTLKQKYGFTLNNLLSLDIVNKNLVSEYITEHGYEFWSLNQSLVTGCGPYSLNITDFDTTNSVVTLRPNPYWELSDNSSFVDELTFKWISDKNSAFSSLSEGTVDIVDSQYVPIVEDYKGINGIRTIITNIPTTREMALNMKHPIIGTGELTPLGTAVAARNLRYAISYTCNRTYLVQDIMGGLGEPATTACPAASVEYNTNLDPYLCDYEKARELIEQAGYDYPETSKTSSVHLSILLGSLIGLSVIILKKKVE